MVSEESDMSETSPYPRSWYLVARSKDVGKGRIRRVEALGQDLVVWRDAAGAPHVMERHCPHMGAAFEQGRVSGDRVVCKFHQWEFGSDGRCARIPEVDEIPRSACVRSWDALDAYGFVWMNHGCTRADFFVREFEGAKSFMGIPRFSEVTAAPDVMLEGGLDVSHLRPVHHQPVVGGEPRLIEDAGDRFVFESDIYVELLGRRLHATNHVTVTGGSMQFGVMSIEGHEFGRWMAGVTPIAHGRTLLGTSCVLHRFPGRYAALTRPALLFFSWDLNRGAHHHDAGIWRGQKREAGRVLLPSERYGSQIRRYYWRQCPAERVERAPRPRPTERPAVVRAPIQPPGA